MFDDTQISLATKILLHFDDPIEPVKDECHNDWDVYGSPQIVSDGKFGKALRLNGANQYLMLDLHSRSDIGRGDFTVDGWLRPRQGNSDTRTCVWHISQVSLFWRWNYSAEVRVGLNTYPASSGDRQVWHLYFAEVIEGDYNNYIRYEKTGQVTCSTAEYQQQWHHWAVVYQHAEKTLSLFVDGALLLCETAPDLLPDPFYVFIGAVLTDEEGRAYFKGDLSEFRFVDGLALYTENFTPPSTAARLSVFPVQLNADVQRVVNPSQAVVQSYVYDTIRAVKKTQKVAVDVIRQTTFSQLEQTVNFDVAFQVLSSVRARYDALRQLPYRFSTMAVSEVEIEIATQQVTDRLSFTTVNDVEIMRVVKGSYLDYDFDMRIESIQRRGIVSTCQCCSDIDELLYKQFAYSLPYVALSKQSWHSTSSTSGGDSGKPDWYPQRIWQRGTATGGVAMIPYIVTNVIYPDSPTVEEADLQPKAAASDHAKAIAYALGKKLVININDFVSTVSTEHEGGSTYADYISNIFGWTARIPTLMINCFIRDDTLFITQRGYEPDTVDITGSKHSIPTVKQELIKTFWHGNTWTRTESRTVTEWKLAMTETNFFDDFDKPKVSTNHKFDDDGLVSQTTRKETKSDGTKIKVETNYEYLTLASGRKFLYREKTRTFEDGSLVDTQVIEHEPLGQGQSYAYASDEDGEYLGSNVGRGRDDDRYNRGRTALPPLHMTFDWIQTKNDPQSRTIPGITNFDTSFPVYGEEALIEITDAIKDLNRRTQETVTVDVYDLPHVIDFNDRIVFHGKTYFLEHNYAVKTTRIVNKQTITMVRWF